MTNLGKSIKIALLDKGKRQNWLIEEVSRKTGLYFDSSYLAKIMNGKSENPKILCAIREILELDEAG